MEENHLEVFKQTFPEEMKETFSLYLLYRIKNETRNEFDISQTHYTIDGVAGIIKYLDEEYEITIKPLQKKDLTG